MPVRETIAPIMTPSAPLTLTEDSLAVPQMEIDKIAIVPFITRLNATQTSAASV